MLCVIMILCLRAQEELRWCSLLSQIWGDAGGGTPDDEEQ